MVSKTPKVLFKILGKPMLSFVVDNAKAINSDEIILVVGKNSSPIQNLLKRKVKYAIQPEPRGSGDAAEKGLARVKCSNVLILSGDVPLLKAETIKSMIDFHQFHQADLTVLTAKIDDPYGYGRIIRNKKGTVQAIVEQADADKNQQKIKEINAGVYYGKTRLIQSVLRHISPNNKQGEYYITDAVKELIKKKKKVFAFTINNPVEIMGINTKLELARAREIVKAQFFKKLMLTGVYIEDPRTTNIDLSVKIGRFVHIRPYTFIEGDTEIKDRATVGPFVWIKDGKVKRLPGDVG